MAVFQALCGSLPGSSKSWSNLSWLCHLWCAAFSHWLSLLIYPKVSKMPAFLRSALHILFSEDSAKLFVASSQGSLHVIGLLEGSFKHLHTFQPQSGGISDWTGDSRCLWWLFLGRPQCRPGACCSSHLADSLAHMFAISSRRRYLADEDSRWGLKCSSHLLLSRWVFDSLFGPERFHHP